MRVKVTSDRDGRTLLTATVRGMDATRLAALVDALDTVAARFLLDDDEAASITAA